MQMRVPTFICKRPPRPRSAERIPSSMIGCMPNRSSYVEPRWPVILALAAVVALHFSLPQILSLGPNWLLVAVFAVLATLVSISHSRGAEGVAYVGGLFLIGSVTVAVITSLVLLVHFLPSPQGSRPFISCNRQPRSGSATCWCLPPGIGSWTQEVPSSEKGRRAMNWARFFFRRWRCTSNPPRSLITGIPTSSTIFFCRSTPARLCPRRTRQILSRWAKVLMMMQSLISMTIIVLLAARAVNIL